MKAKTLFVSKEVSKRDFSMNPKKFIEECKSKLLQEYPEEEFIDFIPEISGDRNSAFITMTGVAKVKKVKKDDPRQEEGGNSE